MLEFSPVTKERVARERLVVILNSLLPRKQILVFCL